MKVDSFCNQEKWDLPENRQETDSFWDEAEKVI